MVSKKIIVGIVILIVVIGLFAGAYYLTKDKIKDEGNSITGNIIYESVKPTIVDPISIESSDKSLG
jgi:Na+-translocating ferredoxin:NAD+ oxidoreductase RnfG subunit